MNELQHFRPRLNRRHNVRFDFERASVILLSTVIRRQSRPRATQPHAAQHG
ncbi:MAG TPA: hypothetical protein VFY35_11100 [Burkholderiaceae bacterium]|nr:hypothetical protein [Burkholderiaceae bacterium]